MIDSSIYANWPSVAQPLLSNNGKYVIYRIENMPIGSHTLVLQSTDAKWKREFKGGLRRFEISSDSRNLFFITGKDSLAKLTLGTNKIEYTPGISNFVFGDQGGIPWISFFQLSSPEKLCLKNLITNELIVFENVVSQQFSKDRSVMILKQISPQDPKLHTISWMNIGQKNISKIWEGTNEESLVIDSYHNQLAFKHGDSIWYYKYGSSSAVCIVSDVKLGISSGLNLANIGNFSKDGKRLFFTLKQKKAESRLESVEIWSYRDPILHSEKDYGEETFSTALDLQSGKTIHLQKTANEMFYYPNSNTDSIALVVCESRMAERWSIASKISSALISTVTGERKELGFLDNINVEISQSGKYLIYFDRDTKNYFSYEILTGTVRNLTKGLDVPWVGIFRDDSSDSGIRGLGNTVWVKNDESVLVYDRYDIWMLDPLAERKPVNITNGYGKKHEVIFNFAFRSYGEEGILKDTKLYLSAFNTCNKDNGFFLKYLGKPGEPERLYMGPYIFNSNSGYITYDTDFPPIKSKNGESYIVRRLGANEAPNYFSTKDFKIFTRLSNLQPQKNSNWYTTELHTWKSLDGRKLQGIMYKPENFDSNKKYPVIFNYYERKSDGLNAFIQPEPLCGSCNINIPSYVSKGYLVFVPDIYYRIGDPMQGTYDAVISAANYLSGFAFVNAKKMGIQGCSFGGIQTNYLLTHSNIFSAACSAVAYADWISTYGAITGNGDSQQGVFETGQQRMGGNLWEKIEMFLKSSPLLRADQVTTPLLMMNNRNDGIIPFSDALGFFTALRRLGKKAWMLSYPEGSHGVTGKDADDFSKRMMQFFDHYLKDRPAPVWMTRGVGASKVGIDSGLELDSTISTPGPGLLRPEELKRVDSQMIRKSILFEIEVNQ